MHRFSGALLGACSVFPVTTSRDITRLVLPTTGCVQLPPSHTALALPAAPAAIGRNSAQENAEKKQTAAFRYFQGCLKACLFSISLITYIAEKMNGCNLLTNIPKLQLLHCRATSSLIYSNLSVPKPRREKAFVMSTRLESRKISDPAQ